MARYASISFEATINVSIDVEDFEYKTGLKPTRSNLIEYAMGNWRDRLEDGLAEGNVFRGDLISYDLDPPVKTKKPKKGIGSW